MAAPTSIVHFKPSSYVPISTLKKSFFALESLQFGRWRESAKNLVFVEIIYLVTSESEWSATLETQRPTSARIPHREAHE